MAETEGFGTVLRRMRHARGMSLRELSRSAPLDPGHLSKIENGHRHPTLDVAKALDRVLQAKGGVRFALSDFLDLGQAARSY
ncbi:helix-turn-helix domain-containing protein [Actinoplanes subtropicus]|uniref:helix-turn-helix domain-containing protein n=1 Tax=Actinoplanes subtropicus TaxID=543632 RepID=UPI0004C3FA06|nr:helix-turn-helix transcriptional regulator [Actinoplanes subtropicus]